jgi:two-component system, LytTR family, sensor histidine kinase AgrC
MKNLGNRLIGDEQNFTFEQRIFNFVMLLSICVASFGTAMDTYYGINALVDLIFIGCWVLTYYFSRFRGGFNIVSVVSTGIFIFAYFPYGWSSSGGSASSTMPCYALVFIAMICMILKGKFRIAMFASALGVIGFLFSRDVYLVILHGGSFQSGVNLILFGLQLLSMMVAMALLIVVYSDIYAKEKARSEAYAKTINENYRQQLYYMKNLEELIDRLKSERHDFNHHLGVIYGLLESGESNKAGEYASRLVKTAGGYQNLVHVPYPMVRAMLNYKLSAAKEQGIRLNLNVGIPEGLALPEFDLTVILGNLLDNAMEACMTVDESDRTISFNMSYKPDYLIIQTENPIIQTENPIIQKKNPVSGASKPQNGSRRTTKHDAENHGYGLRNIEFLAQKHNGFLKTARENGVFKVDVALLTEPDLSKDNTSPSV